MSTQYYEPKDLEDFPNITEYAPEAGNKFFAYGQPMCAEGIDILQINVGRRCNLTCRHCHVEAGPNRTETMGREVFEMCLDVLARHPIGTIDITGGSPGMNPELRWFIHVAAALDG